MTPGCQRNGSWQPPVAARAAASSLFAGVIPNLSAVADGYRVNVDMLDEEIYRMFCEHMRESLGGLATALAAGDETATRGHAHSFEGMGGTMGFPEISAVGVALSRSARAGDWQVCRAIHERLAQWLQVAEATGQTGCLDHE